MKPSLEAETLVAQHVEYLLLKLDDSHFIQASPGITAVISSFVMLLRRMFNRAKIDSFTMQKQSGTFHSRSLSWFRTCLCKLKKGLELVDFPATRSNCCVSLVNLVNCLKESSPEESINSVYEFLLDFFMTIDWSLAFRAAYQNLIEGTFDYKTSACVLIDLFLEHTGDSGFDVFAKTLPHDWSHRVVLLLQIHDADFVSVIHSSDNIDRSHVFMNFKSFFLFLQRVAQCSGGVRALQGAHLIEVLGTCQFLLCSPNSTSKSFIDVESQSLTADDHQQIYFEMLLPVLQLLSTLLVVDRDDERSQYSETIRQYVHDSALHSQISHLLSEHSEGLVIPVIERRLVSIQALSALDVLFEIIRLLSEGPVGIQTSTRNILGRSGSLLHQILSNYIMLSHELNENPDLRVDMELFSGNAGEMSDALDSLCSIVCNFTSILVSDESYLHVGLKKAISPHMISAIECATANFCVKQALLEKYHTALTDPNHYLHLSLPAKSIASIEANLAHSILLIGRCLVLLCEIISKDVELFLTGKEASAHRVFSVLNQTMSESSIGMGTEECERRLMKNLSKFSDFLRPDTVSNRLIFR
eukprot:TRINITY_DN10366_c0_g1_i1.p1 TRINITY_DN10366_c0_g1~~TRINITY_DN10366_c0_g1_i1.p1  ORF type:complete len:586 (+),score=122.87 TRINITY_DN10366_c0_g1_i1:1-1758(+)